jgi:hypothetical protein
MAVHDVDVLMMDGSIYECSALYFAALLGFRLYATVTTEADLS